LWLCPIALFESAFETLDQTTEIFGKRLIFDGPEKIAELLS